VAGDDGKHFYFRIRTKDNAENISAAGGLFDLGYDITLPTRPSFVASDPAGYTTTNSFTLSWPAGTDPTGPHGASGIKWYQYKRGPDAEWSHTADSATRTVAGVTAYQEGANAFYVRTIDNAGNASSDYQQVTYYWSGVAPAKPTGLEVTPGTSDENSFTIHWDKSTTGLEDPPVVGYRYSINAVPTMNNTTYIASQDEHISVGPDAFATAQGQNTVYVLGVNAAGNYSLESEYYASANFTCQTSAPPAPTGVSITDSSNRAYSTWSLTISWQAGPGQDPATFDHYLIERSTDSATYSSLATATSTAYIDASGLNNTTTYYYRIKSVDNAGKTSAASSVVSKLPTGKYTTTPTILSGPESSSIKSNSTAITWITNRDSTSVVRYGKKDGEFDASSGTLDAVSNHSVILMGLDPGTLYYYQTLSADEDRDYPLPDAYSTTHTFTTLAAPAISNVKVGNITLTNADVSWETTTVATSTLHYGLTNSYGSSVDDQSGSGTISHSVKLNSLNPGTGYHFKISGNDSDGNVLTSDDYQFETLPLPEISDIKTSAITDQPTTGCKIVWTTNVPTTSIVKYSTINQTPKEQVKSKSETDHEIVIMDLDDDSIYQIIPQGRDQFGNLAEGLPQTFKTPYDTRAPKITDVILESSLVGLGDKSKGHVIVNWKTDEPATSQVDYSQGISGTSYNNVTVEDKTLTTNHIVIISGLEPARLYHLRAVSADKAGNKTVSSDSMFVPQQGAGEIFEIIKKVLINIFGWANKLL